MRKLIWIFIVTTVLFSGLKSFSQDTFSICAIDPVTGEVGSAGASCVNDCTILSDVHPGYGVIHTQAYWLPANQNYARSLMNLGLSPQAIIDSLIIHDAQSNPTIRQYGIVDLQNGGRTAAYTGVNCDNYKNHILGPTFSIQGNILLGQQILDSMKSRFLNTSGDLAAKLMAAMQGAKVVGADTRCFSWNTSSLSAFLRVAKPGDTLGTLFLDLKVLNTPFGREPIDSLQVLYNNWLTGVQNISSSVPDKFYLNQNYPNPFNPSTIIEYAISKASNVKLSIYDVLGREVQILVESFQGAGVYHYTLNTSQLSTGMYFYKLQADHQDGSGKFISARKLAVMK